MKCMGLRKVMKGMGPADVMAHEVLSSVLLLCQ